MAIRRIAVLCLLASCCANAATRALVVEAGKTDRVLVPMAVPVPVGTTQAKLLDGPTEVPCQVTSGRLCWILDRLPAGQTKTYAVELGTAPTATDGKVSLMQAGDGLSILIDGKFFTKYVFNPKPAGDIPIHRPYFFPVLGPDQTPMTRRYPMEAGDPEGIKKDHPHHTGFYVAHGDVNKVNNWHKGKGVGFQVHKGFSGMTSGPVLAQFTEQLDWTTYDKKPNMAETRTVRIYRLPDTARTLDLVLVFTAKYGKVVFGDTKEGGLCATRMRSEFRNDKHGVKGRLVNAAGQTGGGAWGKKSPWVDCSGEVDGKRLGYAIFDHPNNLRHPTTWHARTYGLLTANPFGLSHFTRKKEKGDYTLEDGKSITFRYRITFHLGDEKEGKVAARFADYAAPPKATWE